MKKRIIKIISFILCIAIIEGQTGINPCEDKKYLQTKPGSLEEAILKSRGLIK